MGVFAFAKRTLSKPPRPCVIHPISVCNVTFSTPLRKKIKRTPIKEQKELALPGSSMHYMMYKSRLCTVDLPILPNCTVHVRKGRRAAPSCSSPRDDIKRKEQNFLHRVGIRTGIGACIAQGAFFAGMGRQAGGRMCGGNYPGIRCKTQPAAACRMGAAKRLRFLLLLTRGPTEVLQWSFRARYRVHIGDQLERIFEIII